MADIYKKVFCALDGSAAQNEVARRAIAIAADNNAELVFGHVIDSVPYEATGVNFEALCEEGRARLEEEEAEMLASAREAVGVDKVSVVVRAGRIGDTLVEQIIKPAKPDLVLCGARGLSNLKYAIVGSISKHLIRSVDCDVLVVKQQ